MNTAKNLVLSISAVAEHQHEIGHEIRKSSVIVRHPKYIARKIRESIEFQFWLCSIIKLRCSSLKFFYYSLFSLERTQQNCMRNFENFLIMTRSKSGRCISFTDSGRESFRTQFVILNVYVLIWLVIFYSSSSSEQLFFDYFRDVNKFSITEKNQLITFGFLITILSTFFL